MEGLEGRVHACGVEPIEVIAVWAVFMRLVIPLFNAWVNCTDVAGNVDIVDCVADSMLKPQSTGDKVGV